MSIEKTEYRPNDLFNGKDMRKHIGMCLGSAILLLLMKWKKRALPSFRAVTLRFSTEMRISTLIGNVYTVSGLGQEH